MEITLAHIAAAFVGAAGALLIALAKRSTDIRRIDKVDVTQALNATIGELREELSARSTSERERRVEVEKLHSLLHEKERSYFALEAKMDRREASCSESEKHAAVLATQLDAAHAKIVELEAHLKTAYKRRDDPVDGVTVTRRSKKDGAS